MEAVAVVPAYRLTSRRSSRCSFYAAARTSRRPVSIAPLPRLIPQRTNHPGLALPDEDIPRLNLHFVTISLQLLQAGGLRQQHFQLLEAGLEPGCQPHAFDLLNDLLLAPLDAVVEVANTRQRDASRW